MDPVYLCFLFFQKKLIQVVLLLDYSLQSFLEALLLQPPSRAFSIMALKHLNSFPRRLICLPSLMFFTSR